jgi:hypothetical protein
MVILCKKDWVNELIKFHQNHESKKWDLDDVAIIES